jgi:succinate dehydrogenase flavin-adding protein (antitoxin of CptAB toxin-antitoxin module)
MGFLSPSPQPISHQGEGSPKVVSDPKNWESQEALLRRVRWRSRRGLLELDIVLARFIDAHYLQLGMDEQQAFEALLDMPDTPLWDMIAGRQEAAQNGQRALLEKIRSA